MFKKILLATTLATFTLGAAQAADLDPVEDVVFGWGGFYAGAQVGYSFGSADHTFNNLAPSDDSDPRGVLGGLHVGYNVQDQSIVYGIEADLNFSNADGSYANFTGATSAGEVDMNWTGSVRGQLGVTNDRLLGFVTAGVAFGDFDLGGGPAPLPTFSGYSERRTGWTVGAGVEYAISESMTARLEYRYTDFGQASGALVPGFPAINMGVDLTSHAVMAGVSFRFGQ